MSNKWYEVLSWKGDCLHDGGMTAVKRGTGVYKTLVYIITCHDTIFPNTNLESFYKDSQEYENTANQIFFVNC